MSTAKDTGWVPVQDGEVVDSGWVPVESEEYVDPNDGWIPVREDDEIDDADWEPLITERVVYRFPVTDTTEVFARVYPWERNGVIEERWDLRVMFLRKRDGEWRPSKRGLSVPKKKLPALLVAVQKLVDAAQS